MKIKTLIYFTESADDDWERDFDVELTEEDLKAADEIAKKLNISSADYTKLSPELVIHTCIYSRLVNTEP